MPHVRAGLWHMHGLRHAAIGFGGGCCVGLVGWGGAQIVVPGLTHPALGGLSQLAASGISVLSQSVAATAGSLNYLQAGVVDLQTAGAIALPSIVGARAGVALARRLQPDLHALIFNGMSVLLLPTHFVVQRWRQQQSTAPKPSEHAASRGASVGTAAFGLVAGAFSALMGIGGGPLAVSFLTLTDASLPHHLVQGTAACAVVPGMLASGAFHARHGSVPAAAACAVTAGAAVGGVCGAQLALRLPEEQLRQCFMGSLVLLGGRSFVAAGRNLAAIARLVRGRT